MAIDGINVENWRAKPVKEVINNINIVEEEDSECAQWAQAMAAVANAPDNVTYEAAGGSIEAFTAELDEITENGLPPGQETEAGKAEDPDAVAQPEETEEGKEDGVEGKDEEGEPPINPNDPANGAENPDKADGATPPEDDGVVPVDDTGETEEGGEEDPNANPDEEILTDEEEIRKRKVKKGEVPTEE